MSDKSVLTFHYHDTTPRREWQCSATFNMFYRTLAHGDKLIKKQCPNKRSGNSRYCMQHHQAQHVQDYRPQSKVLPEGDYYKNLTASQYIQMLQKYQTNPLAYQKEDLKKLKFPSHGTKKPLFFNALTRGGKNSQRNSTTSKTATNSMASSGKFSSKVWQKYKNAERNKFRETSRSSVPSLSRSSVPSLSRSSLSEQGNSILPGFKSNGVIDLTENDVSNPHVLPSELKGIRESEELMRLVTAQNNINGENVNNASNSPLELFYSRAFELQGIYNKGFSYNNWAITHLKTHYGSVMPLVRVYYDILSTEYKVNQKQFQNAKSVARQREPVNMMMHRAYKEHAYRTMVGYKHSCYSRFRARSQLPPSISFYTPVYVKTDLEVSEKPRKIHVLHHVALSLNSDQQYDYKYFQKLSSLEKKESEIRKFYQRVFHRTFTVLNEFNDLLDNIVMSPIGVGSLSRKYDKETKGKKMLELFIEEWDKYVEKYKVIERYPMMAFMINELDEKESKMLLRDKYADYGPFPETLWSFLDGDESKTLFVTFGDSNSIPGNGHEKDDTLNGILGAHSTIALSTNPHTNLYLDMDSSYCGINKEGRVICQGSLYRKQVGNKEHMNDIESINENVKQAEIDIEEGISLTNKKNFTEFKKEHRELQETENLEATALREVKVAEQNKPSLVPDAFMNVDVSQTSKEEEEQKAKNKLRAIKKKRKRLERKLDSTERKYDAKLYNFPDANVVSQTIYNELKKISPESKETSHLKFNEDFSEVRIGANSSLITHFIVVRDSNKTTTIRHKKLLFKDDKKNMWLYERTLALASLVDLAANDIINSNFWQPIKSKISYLYISYVTNYKIRLDNKIPNDNNLTYVTVDPDSLKLMADIRVPRRFLGVVTLGQSQKLVFFTHYYEKYTHCIPDRDKYIYTTESGDLNVTQRQGQWYQVNKNEIERLGLIKYPITHDFHLDNMEYKEGPLYLFVEGIQYTEDINKIYGLLSKEKSQSAGTVTDGDFIPLKKGSGSYAWNPNDEGKKEREYFIKFLFIMTHYRLDKVNDEDFKDLLLSDQSNIRENIQSLLQRYYNIETVLAQKKTILYPNDYLDQLGYC